MRCAKKCFSIILATAVGGMPTPENVLPFRAVEVNALSQGALRAIHSVLVNRTPNIPIERRTLYH